MSRSSISRRQVLVRIHLLAIYLITCRHNEGFLGTRIVVLHVSWVRDAHDRLKLVLGFGHLGLSVVALRLLCSCFHLFLALLSCLHFSLLHQLFWRQLNDGLAWDGVCLLEERCLRRIELRTVAWDKHLLCCCAANRWPLLFEHWLARGNLVAHLHLLDKLFHA